MRERRYQIYYLFVDGGGRVRIFVRQSSMILKYMQKLVGDLVS
jgi:hypothetical protein